MPKSTLKAASYERQENNMSGAPSEGVQKYKVHWFPNCRGHSKSRAAS